MSHNESGGQLVQASASQHIVSHDVTTRGNSNWQSLQSDPLSDVNHGSIRATITNRNAGGSDMYSLDSGSRSKDRNHYTFEAQKSPHARFRVPNMVCSQFYYSAVLELYALADRARKGRTFD